jgi:hypothetical protein
VAEMGGAVPEGRRVRAGAGAADSLEAQEASRISRLARRLKALNNRQRHPEPTSPLQLLTTDELRLVLGLVERGGVLPSGEVSRPEVFRSPAPEESKALERWKQLCGEPLDHLEAAEELLDRAGEAHGWYSREAVHAALLLARLELPDASPWFVGKRAEGVLNLYAELEEHGDEPQHPHVRGAVRRLERLKQMSRLAPELEPAPQSLDEDELPKVASTEGAEDPTGILQRAAERSDREEPHPATGGDQAGARTPWWRRVFGSGQ